MAELRGPTPRREFRSTAIGALAALWAFAFIAFFGTYVTTFEPGLRLFAAIAFGLPVVIVAVIGVVRTYHPLDVPVLGTIGVYALVSITSVDRTASLETLMLVGAYASVFLLLTRLNTGPIEQGLVNGTAVAVAVWLAIIACTWVGEAVTWVALDGTLPPFRGRSGSLWLSSDAVACLPLLGAPYFARIERRSIRRVAGGVAIAGSAVVIPLSSGRVEWIGIGIAAAAYVAVRRIQRRPAGIRAWHVVVVAIAAVGAVVALTSAGAFGTISGRTHIWQTAWAVVERHPIVGAGPGTFSWVRLAESPDLLNPYPVYHAHNIVLQQLADGGFVLLAAFSLLCFTYLRHVARRAWPARMPERTELASLAGFAVVLMLDELTQLPALTVMALGSAAFIARSPERSRRLASVDDRRRATAVARAVALCLVIAAATPATIAAHVARSAATDAREAAVAGEWERAERAYAAASAAWPSRASYHLGRGLALAHLGLLDDAMDAYRRAEALSPGDRRAAGAIGALERDDDERIAALGRAARLGPPDPQYAFRLALAQWRTDRDGAERALAAAVVLDPQLLAVANGYEIDYDAVVQSVDTVLDRHATTLAVDAASVRAGVAVALGRIGPVDAVFSALARARSGDVARARSAISDVLAQEPHHYGARLVALELSRLACDTPEASRHERLLGLLPGGYTALYIADDRARESRDHIYRELGLGDYQPPSAEALPVYQWEWPAGYLPAPACDRS